MSQPRPTDAGFELELQPHPQGAWAKGFALRVSGRWCARQALLMDWRLSTPTCGVHRQVLSEAHSAVDRLSAVQGLRLPAAQPPGPADGLWQRTCFEAFVAAPGSSAYHEFNLSPSGQWARYRFSDQRVRDRLAEQQAPVLALPMRWRTEANALELQTALPLADWPSSGSGWLLGLAAVLEHSGGRLSHWALHHPKEQPDFHHPGGRLAVG